VKDRRTKAHHIDKIQTILCIAFNSGGRLEAKLISFLGDDVPEAL